MASNEKDMQSRLKDALLALQKVRSRLEAVERAKTEPIAIIGMGCRFPGGANTTERFWELMQNGVDAISEVPESRWDINAYYDPDPDAPGKIYTRLGGFIDAPEGFDSQFFGIAPREAKSLDPQQRLLLEVTWEALENAALPPDQLAGTRTGVFVGITSADYITTRASMVSSSDLDAYHITGSALNGGIGRISYTLGLRGPALAVDTACSSSLVALHLAVQSLRNGESDTALAGGVNLLLTPETSIGASRAHMLSPDGHCKTFDASADGFGRGEGCGVIVVKRLSDALAAGDHITAVIRGSAINHGGFSSGFTVPNKLSQEAVIRAALENAGVKPAEVSYVEAHGTGTSLGDPIEVRALTAVLGEGRTADRPLMLGSVKTNVGHLEAAAGIIGVIKLALALEHGEIPPHLHLKTLNPYIAWNEMSIEIPTERTPWQGKRIGGVSSFGASGMNAHAILEAATVTISGAENEKVARPQEVITLSARSEAALRTLAANTVDWLDTHPTLELADMALTANTGRVHFSFRLAGVAKTTEQFRRQLAAFASGEDAAALAYGYIPENQSAKIAFLFTGQGAQYVGMGRGLYETQPVFRAALDQCDDLLRPHLAQPLLSVIFAEKDASAALLNDTTYTQPALFALEYALAELWLSWGVQPSAVMGHSVGEYVAACIAGVFSLEDGLKLIAARGRLMGNLPSGGTMVAVLADEKQVEAAIAPYADRVSIAGVNGSGNFVISGAQTAVDAIVNQLQANGVKTHPLVVSHAFHSPLMDSILDEFERIAGEITYQSPRFTLISNVTGEAFARGEIPDATYWRKHIRAAVQFKAGMETLHAQGYQIFLEVGPHPTLLGMGRDCVPENTGVWLPSLRKGKDDWEQILGGLSGCEVNGIPVNWAAFHKGYAGSKILLPNYPYERRSYPILPKRHKSKSAGNSLHPLLGSRLQVAGQGVIFENVLDVEALPILADHLVMGQPVLPASAYVEMLLAAGHIAFDTPVLTIEDVVIQEALIIPAEGSRTIQTLVSPDGAIQIFNQEENGNWRLNASALVRAETPAESAAAQMDALRANLLEEVPTDFHFQRLEERGVQFGDSFRGLERIWRKDGEALGYIRLPESASGAYHMHPGLLDACLQPVGVLFSAGDDTFLPISMDGLHIYHLPQNEVWSHLRLRPAHSHDIVTADIRLLDASGTLLVELNGVAFKRVVGGLARGTQPANNDWLYQIEWQRKDLPMLNGTHDLSGQWLILADQSGLGSQIAEFIQSNGGQPILVREGSDYQNADGQFIVNSARPEDFERLLQAVNRQPLRHIVHLWGIDSTSEPNLQTLHEAQILGSASTLHLLQALLKTGASPHLWLVTRGVFALGNNPAHPAQAPLWGLGKVIAQEHPEFHATCIDLSEDIAGEMLAATLFAPDDESQIALRADGRYVARLAHMKVSESQALPDILDGAPFQLDITEKGVLDNLYFAPLERRAPGAGEIEIRIQAAGLGFRDVLNAMGMYPGDIRAMGNEAVGTVVTVGVGVDQFQVGDTVIALVEGSFASYATTLAELAVLKPKNLTIDEAATIPSPFLTAYFGLHQLAKMKAGDRVLIHAAAGGVGLAAVQLARQAGAEIFGTAGSDDKRAYLKSIGVQHVLNSRTLDFADEIRAITGGEGVNIVLNSLSGEFISNSVNLLAENGCFLEIGKRDIWMPEHMAAVRPDADYHIIDLLQETPALLQAMFRDLCEGFEAGTLQPIPNHTFPIHQAVDAFRYMAQAKHMGRIILRFDAADHVSIRSDATYLVTGGLRGLGLAVVQWLAEHGARHLAVMGRSAPSAEAEVLLNQLDEMGVQVTVIQGDVSEQDNVSHVLETINQNMPPLRGIIHCAGVYDDGVLAGQDWGRFEKIFAPKVQGSWNLHTLTQGIPLDFLVFFSTISTLLGAAGQGNYVAANSFMDTLAFYRRARGLPALSLNWGPWSELGKVTDERVQGRLLGQGFQPFTSAEALDVMGTLIVKADLTQAGIMSMNWEQYLQQFPSGAPAFFSTVGHKSRAIPGEAKTKPVLQSDLMKRLIDAPPSKRQSLLIEFVRAQAVKALGLEASFSIDPRQPLQSLGLDSLMAVELRNLLGAGLGLTRSLPATLIFDYATLEAIAGYLVKAFFSESEKPAASAEEDAAKREEQATLDELAELSDEEAEALLLEELNAMKKKK